MRILITNDDGIQNKGIRLLAEWAKKLGEVTVVAPKVEQSGKSHAIDFVTPVEIKKVDLLDGVEAYSMSSTPADCIRFGVLGLGKKFDLILSGINCGVNLGADIVYSGTVGAIFEASRMHVPAIAFSAFPDGQEIAVKYLDEVYDYIMKNELFKECPLFNVNIPNESKGIRMTYQGSPYFSDRFIHREGDIYVQEGEPISDVCPEDMDRDTVALVNGYISVTPLLATRTDMGVFEKYRSK
ncbi:MAG: 5'/3'-nucleotidase SurE [Clostridiales bacterium]|nr:5'/3'-nucleotidase SurE [Clostridiales bacterium]